MSDRRRGAAPAKETAPVGRWLDAADAMTILPDGRDEGDLTPRQALMAIAVGLPLLYLLMFCAAAY